MKHYFYLLILLLTGGLVLADESIKGEAAEVSLFAPALAKASKENKSVFLLFTDRDGCGSCNMMENAILLTPEFKEFSAKKIIYLELDFSAATNGGSLECQKLSVDYNVESFPTLLLVDNAGLPYQKFQYQGQTKQEFIAEIEKALTKKELKTKFLNSKNEDEKKKIAADFVAARVDGENFIFFADLIAYGVLNDKNLKVEEKIKELGDLYIYSKDDAFIAKLVVDLKKLDPEKKLGTTRLFVIREFINLVMAKKDDKAFEYFLTNKAIFKGEDLGYLYQFGTHLIEIGKPEKMVEIIAFILLDEEVKTNEESVKYLTEQMNSLKKPKEESKKEAPNVNEKSAPNPEEIKKE
jgi:thioredoxin-related protein